jgi:hypothetical protein
MSLPRMLSLSALLLLAPGASGTTMYAVNHLGSYPDSAGPDTLVMFDTNHPADYVTIGAMDVPNVGFGGLDFDADGNLWTYATFNKVTGGAKSGLYRVDPTTGLTTPQGSLSSQTLTDLAFNPSDGMMYGVFSQGYANTHLFTVDLDTGDVTNVGTFTGFEDQHNIVGLAIDSDGTFFLHDNINNRMYAADGLVASELYAFDVVAVGSQGMTIDWSRGDIGYHATIGQGDFPNYFNNLNTFAPDGSSYVWGPDWGPNYSDGLPQVQPGDVAIAPIPAPGGMVGFIALAAWHRRRR